MAAMASEPVDRFGNPVPDATTEVPTSPDEGERLRVGPEAAAVGAMPKSIARAMNKAVAARRPHFESM
jgi:hypothetical protein